ncbi:hypothetical protein [Histidinibacterium aquaticum]|uniref:META domain-containing protein n=1 Tax=Histidinibacterium aquaticum TaxID=2613962 RepID=A0A5J5GNQ8_9RHOB|nr:hypothetical protein [Histidinibacterium aquaticum]KAA9009780.1 hypothetical protein F3S47_00485 [Histidinibacterium aquaticum]
MPRWICALALTFLLPAAASADWSLETDEADPIALGPGPFGLSMRVSCEDEAPAFNLAGVLVQGAPGPRAFTVSVDGTDFGPFEADCDGETCALDASREATDLTDALRAGLRAVVSEDEVLQTISLRGSDDALSELACTEG